MPARQASRAAVIAALFAPLDDLLLVGLRMHPRKHLRRDRPGAVASLPAAAACASATLRRGQVANHWLRDLLRDNGLVHARQRAHAR